jgi:hypothetical protein
MIEPWILSIGVGTGALLVYLRTMCRTIYVGDSGELAAAVHVMGIPHPPGYPLYVLLGKLFSVLVPVGKPALRLNLFSATCASLASAFLYLTLCELAFDRWLAAGVALALAFSASLWSQAGIARVYALGALISSLATYFYARWHMNPEQMRWLLASAFVVGLGLANHPVVGAHLPAIAVAAALHRPEVLSDPLLWLKFAACVVPGVLLYFTWIPLRARAKPPVNWGNIHDIKSLRAFLGRKEYWRHRWVHNPRQALEVIEFYLRRVGTEYGFVGSAAIVVGMPIVFMKSPPLGTMVAILVSLNTFSMIAHARREDIFHWTRYMITAWFALALPLAYGWQLMLGAFPGPAQPYFSFLPAAILLITQFRRQDLSRHRYADEYNRRILQSLPEGATLIAQDDNVVFPLMYLRYAEGLRPDIKLLEQGVHQLAELRFNPKRDVVYCTHWQAAFNTPPTQRGPGLRLLGEGLVYRIVTTDMNWHPRDLWGSHLIPDMEDGSIPRNYLTRCLLGHVYFMRGEWELPRDAVSAAAWYQRSGKMAYDSAVQQFNLGLAYERQGWKKLSDDAFEQARKIDPKYTRAVQKAPDREPQTVQS